MDKDIIEILYAQHTQNNEKNVILGDAILLVYQNKDFLDKVKKYIVFFDRHLARHFKNEDLLVDMMRRRSSLSGKENKVIEEIKEEHEVMTGKYAALKEIIKSYDQENKKTRKNIFKAVNNLVKDIIKHAEKEDLYLFPVAREKLSQHQKNQLEAEIQV